MYFPDPAADKNGPSERACGMASSPAAGEQRSPQFPDPTMLKKRKRDMGEQEKQNVTMYLPNNIQYLSSKFQDGCPFLHRVETRPEHISPHSLRPRLIEPISLKRRRLQLQQQQQQQPQQLHSRKPHSLPDINTSAPEEYASAQKPPFSPLISPKTKVPPTPDYYQSTETSRPPLLSACHICHRRPTTHSLLDAYADCDLCNQRTCYICLRECDGPECFVREPYLGENFQRNPGRKVCSWCAVEGINEDGSEAVRCLHCVGALGEGIR